MGLKISKFCGESMAVTLNVARANKLRVTGGSVDESNDFIIYIKRGGQLDMLVNLMTMCETYYNNLPPEYKKRIPELDYQGDLIADLGMHYLFYMEPLISFLIETKIQDWEKVFDDNGEPVPYSKEACRDLFNSVPTLVVELLLVSVTATDLTSTVDMDAIKKK